MLLYLMMSGSPKPVGCGIPASRQAVGDFSDPSEQCIWLAGLAFPDDLHSPSESEQILGVPIIALNVAR
jgi:hypothetical protein